MSTTWISNTPALLLALAAACAAPRAHVQEVLAPREGRAPRATVETLATGSIVERAYALQDQADRDARIARAALRAGTPDAEAKLEASRALLLSADARIQCAALELTESATLERTVLAEDDIGEDVRTAVFALGEEGRLLAAGALAERPESCEARFLEAVHLSLALWAEGFGRSLLKGRGLEVKEAVERAAETCPEHDGAAPLRLRGRFRTQAPWPYRDYALAKQALERASELGPVPLTFLFLGDACHLAGDYPGARAAWSRALEVEPDAATELLSPLYVELARRRLSRLIGGE